MNDDNNAIDIELQVRVLNLVLGEASDFERDQLQQLMEKRPELADYFQHLEYLHGLMSEVSAGDLVREDDLANIGVSWKLPHVRRRQLLTALEGAAQAVVPLTATELKPERWLIVSRKNLAILTACASVVLLGLMALSMPAVDTARKVAASRLKGAISGTESSADASTVDSVAIADGELYDPDRIAAWQAPSRYFSESNFGVGGSNEPAVSMDTPVLGKPPSMQPEGRLGETGFGDAFGSQVNQQLSSSDAGFAMRGMRSAGADPGSREGMGGMGGMGGGMPNGRRGGVALEQKTPSNSAGRTSSANEQAVFEPYPKKATGAGHHSSQDVSDKHPRLLLPNDLELDQLNPADVPSSLLSSSEERVPMGKNGNLNFYRQSVRQAQQDSAGIDLPSIDFDDPFAQPLSNQPYDIEWKAAVSDGETFANNVPEFGGFAVPSKQAAQPPGVDGLSLATSNEIGDKKDKSFTDRRQLTDIDEQTAAVEPFSTFSLHVGDVSFKLAQESLSQGKMPQSESIRIEEFVNALDYRDPLPGTNQKVACRIEQAMHPFLMQRNLLRISLRTSATGRASSTPLRLTLLLDNSGSMERPDRRQIVQTGLRSLVSQLRDTDQVTLISFASSPRLVADKVPGIQAQTLQQIVEAMPSEGGTNIEAALLLAGEKALEQQLIGAQNRIVLMTDGAVNLGNADTNHLAELVTQLRNQGIAFDAAGISAHELNDRVLEALTRQGDGRYYLLDSVDAAGERFANEIAGALRPSAKNVKVQVEFNPRRVGRYRLLGFDQHRLNPEDFRNDDVDAAELAAAEAGVAVYHFEVLPGGSGDVGNVSVRFQDLGTNEMVQQCWPIPYEPILPSLDQANPSMRIAGAAALFATKLQGGPLAEFVDLEQLNQILSALPAIEANQPRVLQLRTMIQQAKGDL